MYNISNLLFRLQSVKHTTDVLMSMYKRLDQKRKEMREEVNDEYLEMLTSAEANSRSDVTGRYARDLSDIEEIPVEFNQTDLLEDNSRTLCSSNTIQEVLKNAIDCGCVDVRLTYVKQKVLKYRLTCKGVDVCYLLELADVYEAVKVFDELWVQNSISDDHRILGLLKEYNDGFPTEQDATGRKSYNEQYLEKICNICSAWVEGIDCNEDKYLSKLALHLVNRSSFKKDLLKLRAGIYEEDKWDLGQACVLIKTFIRANEIELMNVCVEEADNYHKEVRHNASLPVQTELVTPLSETITSGTVPLESYHNFKLQICANRDSEQNTGEFKEIYFLGEKAYVIGRYICPQLNFIVGQRKARPPTYVSLNDMKNLDGNKVGISSANMKAYGVSDMVQLPIRYDVDDAGSLVLKTLGGTVKLKPIKCEDPDRIYDKFQFDVDTEAYSYLKNKFVYKLWE